MCIQITDLDLSSSLILDLDYLKQIKNFIFVCADTSDRYFVNEYYVTNQMSLWWSIQKFNYLNYFYVISWFGDLDLIGIPRLLLFVTLVYHDKCLLWIINIPIIIINRDTTFWRTLYAL